MALAEINWKPSARELRTFGVTMLVGFALIGGFFFWRDLRTVACVLWGIGAAAGVLGLTGTKAAMVVYLPWMGIALVMGNIMSRLILGIVYYLLITPMALCMRLFGRDKLHLKRRDGDTYWTDMAAPPTEVRAYERQF